jgi:serine/threonine protein kinase
VSGIVQIYDVFQENDTAYIVMEFLEGEDLGTRLKREKTISADEAVKIMVPVLEALSAVHQSKIIHRDIAPNNIFLCKDGRVKLLDFGAARSATGTYSKSLTVLYKEGYTAEEQYQSRGEQGPWTDVYAAAATMYKAITGVTPDGAMERRRKDRLKEPSKCGVKIEKNVERAIMNALIMDHKKRTQSAEIFNCLDREMCQNDSNI